MSTVYQVQTKRGKVLGTYPSHAEASAQAAKLNRDGMTRGWGAHVVPVTKANPRKVHTAKFDRCVRKVKRRRGRKKVRNAFAVCTARLGRKAFRRKRRNPSRYKGRGEYIVVAQKKGGHVLKLVEGNKFAQSGRPVVFPTERAAAATARWLRRLFPVLKGYNPHAAPR